MFEQLPDQGTIFLRSWSKIKEAETGKKTRIKKLGEKEEKILKKFLKSGYTLQDFEDATKALFNDPNKYAINNGLDVPLHLLRNFERYLETAESVKERKAKEKEPKKEENGNFLNRDEWAQACWNEYKKSLSIGRWIGTVAHAIPISKRLAESVKAEKKAELWKQAQEERAQLIERKKEFSKPIQIAEFELKTAVNIYAEKIVIEAVKQKNEPWKH